MSKKVKRIKTNCLVCGKEIITTENRVKHGRGRVCSPICRGLRSVDNMNAKHPRKNMVANFKGPKRGKDNGNWKGNYITKTCDFCGKSYTKPAWIYKRSKNTESYCSKKCRDDFRRVNKSGSNSPYWVGGPDTYRGRDWRNIRLDVVRKQNGKCNDCKKFMGDSLPVHHIKPYRNFKSSKSANQVSNLIGLCQSCHMKREGFKTA